MAAASCGEGEGSQEAGNGSGGRADQLKKDFTSGAVGDVFGEVFGDFDVDLRSPSFEV